MGVVPPADGFLRALRELCDAHGALLIFDEVISGFRAGSGGAQALCGRRPGPDVPRQDHRRRPAGRRVRRARRSDGARLAGGTGLSGGHAVGNPLAMTAGIWCLDHLTPRLYRDLAALGTRLAAGLADAAREAGVALQVNAFGSLLTPFFTDQPVRDYASATGAEHGAVRDVFPRDARARRLSAAVAVRGVVPVGGAHREGRGQDDRGARARRCAKVSHEGLRPTSS